MGSSWSGNARENAFSISLVLTALAFVGVFAVVWLLKEVLQSPASATTTQRLTESLLWALGVAAGTFGVSYALLRTGVVGGNAQPPSHADDVAERAYLERFGEPAPPQTAYFYPTRTSVQPQPPATPYPQPPSYAESQRLKACAPEPLAATPGDFDADAFSRNLGAETDPATVDNVCDAASDEIAAQYAALEAQTNRRRAAGCSDAENRPYSLASGKALANARGIYDECATLKNRFAVAAAPQPLPPATRPRGCEDEPFAAAPPPANTAAALRANLIGKPAGVVRQLCDATQTRLTATEAALSQQYQRRGVPCFGTRLNKPFADAVESTKAVRQQVAQVCTDLEAQIAQNRRLLARTASAAAAQPLSESPPSDVGWRDVLFGTQPDVSQQ